MMSLITQGKTNLTYLLIVIMLAVIAGGGILFYYYSWIADLDTRLTQIELKLPEVKIPVDETANWKTYKNEEYGFELKYPSGCEIKGIDKPIEPYKDSSGCGNISCKETEIGDFLTSFCVSPEAVVYRTEASIYVSKSVTEREIEKGVTRREERNINNTLFSEDYTIQYGGMGSWSRIVNAFAQHPSKNYHFIIHSPTLIGLGGMPEYFWTERPYSFTEDGREWVFQNTKAEGEIKFLNQILSTFKFLE